MNRTIRIAFAALCAVSVSAAEKPQINVTELTLGNGMKWLLFERHESPTVNAGWVARVGSVNERPGITGISHFFEHMMFKGTTTIGTTDIAADLKLIEEQERLREGLRGELAIMRERLRKGEIDDLAKPENKTERYKEIEKQFDALVLKQRETIVKDHMDQIYTKNGGEFLNATTSEDWTVYYLRLPSNKLELWAWLESDRLLNPVLREFYSERDVVFEERRMRTDSTPLGKFDEDFNALFWEAHPYQWPVVGWASDIPSYTLQQAKDYFATYYAPNNLTGVLVGDFKVAEVKPLLERYFGRIPRGKTNPPEVVTLEPQQLAERRMNAEAETSPTVRVYWKSVPAVHKDGPPLDILADVLSGRTGRLYKGLVRGREIANEVSASNSQKKYGGSFEVEVTVKDGKEPAAVEAAIYEEIDKLQKELVPADELLKVKNQEKANAFRRLVNPTFIMFQLLLGDAIGDWQQINTYPEKVDAVTAADVQRVAKEYFSKETRTVGTFLRKAEKPGEAAAPADAELAALPPEAQAMVKQAISQLEAQNDPAKIREGLTRMQSMAGQAPPEMKPVLDLIIKKAQERIALLEKSQDKK